MPTAPTVRGIDQLDLISAFTSVDCLNNLPHQQLRAHPLHHPTEGRGTFSPACPRPSAPGISPTDVLASMHLPLIASLVRMFPSQTCGGEAPSISGKQPAACRLEAEQGSTAQVATRLNATRFKRHFGSTPQPKGVHRALPPSSQTPIHHDAYVDLLREKVVAAASELTSASTPWIVASSSRAPDSHPYRQAKRNDDGALANLDLLPPDRRQATDRIPTGVQVCTPRDKEELS